jgi:hypothetical protein
MRRKVVGGSAVWREGEVCRLRAVAVLLCRYCLAVATARSKPQNAKALDELNLER